MSRRAANITLTVLLLVLIGLMVWMSRALTQLQNFKKAAHERAAPAAAGQPRP